MCSRANSRRNLVFLSGDLVLQVKLLRLQLVHPLPQLFGFLSVRCTKSDNVVLPVPSALSGSFLRLKPATFYLLESLLVRVVDVQRLTSVAQDLLLLLSLRLPFAAALFRLCGRVEGIRTCVLDPCVLDPPNRNAASCLVYPPASACTLQNGGS